MAGGGSLKLRGLRAMVALGLVLVLSATAACGDGGGGGGGTDAGEVNTERVAVDAWAAEVCSAAEEKIPEFVASIEGIDLEAVRDEDIGEGTRFVKALLPASLDFTGAFLEAMAAAGIPDTDEAPSAEDWRALMVKSRESLEDVSAEVNRILAELDPETATLADLEAANEEIEQVTARLEEELETFKALNGIADLDSAEEGDGGELGDILKEGEECEGIQQRLEDEFAKLESGDNG